MHPRNARYEKVHNPAGSANDGKSDVHLRQLRIIFAMGAGVVRPGASVNNSAMRCLRQAEKPIG